MFYKIASLLFLLMIITSCKNSYMTKPSFKEWSIAFNQKAKNAGISDKTLADFSEHLEYIPQVIKLDHSQPDKTKTFQQYLSSVLNKKRIDTARKKYSENSDILTKIYDQYDVDPSVIIALVSLESNFGNNMGNFKLTNSLATLSYEGRRAKFFETELINALKILDQENIHAQDLKGSWAGAMGQTQFMPSSFLKFAVDYDNDGKRDIWHNNQDSFASVANYLKQNGWNKNAPWGHRVRIPNGFDRKLIDLTVKKSLQSWQELGIIPVDAQDAAIVSSDELSLIQPVGDFGYGYLVYPNYKVIMKWNRSIYFATTIFMLSDSIKKLDLNN